MIKNIGSGSINSSYYSNGITKLKISAFSNVRTKGQCKISEKELIKKIKELARRDAASGKNSQYAQNRSGISHASAEWIKLREDYISFASPDRTKLIQKSLSNLSNQVSTMQPKKGVHNGRNGKLNFFSIIFENSKHSGSRAKVNFLSVHDEFGNEIAQYSPATGWNVFPTPAESARNTEFCELWKKSLADAQYELEQESKGTFLA